MAGNAERLRPGMAFSVEPGIYLEGRYGARLEDIVVCGEDGPIVLNRAPLDLYVVDGGGRLRGPESRTAHRRPAGVSSGETDAPSQGAHPMLAFGSDATDLHPSPRRRRSPGEPPPDRGHALPGTRTSMSRRTGRGGRPRHGRPPRRTASPRPDPAVAPDHRPALRSAGPCRPPPPHSSPPWTSRPERRSKRDGTAFVEPGPVMTAASVGAGERRLGNGVDQATGPVAVDPRRPGSRSSLTPTAVR